MLDTPQRYPRAGSQSYPTPAAEPNADGSTTIYFGPKQPDGVKPGNWIQTMPGKGWSTILRLYSPLEPFFTKKWRRARSNWCNNQRSQALGVLHEDMDPRSNHEQFSDAPNGPPFARIGGVHRLSL